LFGTGAVAPALTIKKELPAMNTRTLITALALGAAALGTAACNTVEGAGEDLQSASREVKEEI
jgi:predicted small secreted protein